MGSDGWVCVHRKAERSAVFQDEGLWKLFCLCLFRANHEDSWVKVDGLAEPVYVRRGQFITGRYALHRAYYPKRKRKMAGAITLWRWMKTLSGMRNLSLETNSRFTLVTICNYETYQNITSQNEQAGDQPVISRRSAGDQPVITNNNSNNSNNENKHSGRKRPRTRFKPPSLADVTAYCRQRNNGIDPEEFFAHYEANGWVQGKGKPIKSWQMAVITWEKQRAKKEAPRCLPPTDEDLAEMNAAARTER